MAFARCTKSKRMKRAVAYFFLTALHQVVMA
jgi:hypothetical protein